MIKSLLAFFLVLSLSLPLFAQSVDTAWVRRYDGPDSLGAAAYAIAIDGSSNVIVTGSITDSVATTDYATIKYLPNGDTSWVRRYNGSGNGNDAAKALKVDGAGNIYVTGASSGNGTGTDFATIKYLPNGDTAWVRRYNGPSNSGDGATAMAVDDSGKVYVTGYFTWGSYQTYCTTIKYYPNGDTAWVRRHFELPGSAKAIAVDGSGDVYVTGIAVGGTYSYDYATIKYHPNGDTAWLRMYNGPMTGTDGAVDLKVDDLGNVYVTGTSDGDGTNSDYATIKYYPNGDTAWVRRYNGPGNIYETAFALGVDGSGNVYVTGSSFGSVTYGDYATIKYYANGDTAWVRRYDGSANNSDVAYALAVDGLGNVFVTGASYEGVGGSDYATIKYDPSGDEVWLQKYNGPGNGSDQGYSLAIDNSGNVCVSGFSEGSGAVWDYATIKYAQFRRGDANHDTKVTIADIVYLVSYLFKFGPAPNPIQSGDANCSGKVDIADIVYLVSYLFKFGPAPCI